MADESSLPFFDRTATAAGGFPVGRRGYDKTAVDDYVRSLEAQLADARARRLYVTHSASVHILDLDTLRPIGEVTGLRKAHGVAIAGGKGFASDGPANAVIVFDPATGRSLRPQDQRLRKAPRCP